MENPISSLELKTDRIRRLLEEAIPNSAVYDIRKWRDWMKYEVICGANKSFLCVSDEFLADLDEAEMAKRFERAGVARAIQANPDGCILLTRNGIQQGSCGDI